ncbi:MAG: hypothetical protein JWQ34_3793 [Mucilaginibacter sp.]|nr:hypothetical protein [Mucilaginibacter sp.]
MLCNNIRTKVSVLVNYSCGMMHSIAQRTFFLHYGARRYFGKSMGFGFAVGCNFMLMGINYILPRYKAD